MSAALTSEKADVERIAVLIEECKKMGLEVLAPDINESFIAVLRVVYLEYNPTNPGQEVRFSASRSHHISVFY